ncbi:hypothetical protein HCCG_01251 [Helicobacter cinaedi CCUG 18818 = ATCC BAA-847]|uniref:Uncharacterized protein n=1 Tax=Helicobacter cinaedi CCUG 18818 = ATCC BAA-847 TaxID=537971 RepID=A0ABN0BAX4_9HELI|nr:hypothetical protein HCCG_01251 [Helicobacter cinaedi CCUG 18818 = ATCC BAA-847]
MLECVGAWELKFLTNFFLNFFCYNVKSFYLTLTRRFYAIRFSFC